MQTENKEIKIKVVGSIDLSQFEKKPKQKVEVQTPPVPVLDTVLINFSENNQGKIIGRTMAGKIAFIAKGTHKPVKDNETWACTIKTDNPKFCHVIPVTLYKSAAQNADEALQGFKELKATGFKRTEHHPKGTKFVKKL